MASELTTLNFSHRGVGWSAVVYISHASVTSVTLMQVHQHEIGVTPTPLQSVELRRSESDAALSILCWPDFIDWSGGEAVSAAGARVAGRLCLCLQQR